MVEFAGRRSRYWLGRRRKGSVSVHGALGVTVATAAQTFDQSMQTRVRTLLGRREFPQVLARLQGQAAGLQDHLDALFDQVADDSDLLVVLVQTLRNRHTHRLPCPTRDRPRLSTRRKRRALGQAGLSLRAFGVAAEDAEEVGDLAEVVEGVDGDGGIGASQEVQVEEVFPGLAAKRARFNLDHAEIAQGEGAEGAEEGAGDVAGAEYQRGLPLGVGGGAKRMAARVIGSAQQEEAGKILAVAFKGA